MLSEAWWHCWEVAIHEIMSKWSSVSGYAVLFQEWELYGTSIWRVFSMEEAQQALKTGMAGRVDREHFCAPSLHRNTCILGARESSPEKVNPWSIGRVQLVPFSLPHLHAKLSASEVLWKTNVNVKTPQSEETTSSICVCNKAPNLLAVFTTKASYGHMLEAKIKEH